MSRFSSFKEFNKKRTANIENYKPPKYLVMPHKGETGFFMFRKEFDKLKPALKSKKSKKAFIPGIRFAFADEK